jgi:GT2 family glycosyltransferase
MDLSICILTHHQPKILPRCVLSCITEIERAHVSGEIIVIDNASTDGSPQTVIGLSPPVRVIRNDENLGFSTANNRAIRASHGRNVLILNDDAVLQPGSLALMLDVLESNPNIAAVGPNLVNPDGSAQTNYTNRRFPRWRGLVVGFMRLEPWFEKHAFTRDLFTQARDPGISGETGYVAAACLLARRRALEGVGLFDEAFYYWFEDADLCYRLKRSGWLIVYVAEARVTHYGSASTHRFTQLEKSAITFRSMMYFFRKHWSPGRYLFFSGTVALALFLRIPVLVLVEVVRRASRRRPPDDSLRASLRALRWLLLERT